MQRENEKSFSSPGAFVSPNSTSKILSQTLVSRPKGIAKQRRNEKQQAFYHLEQVIDVQVSSTKLKLVYPLLNVRYFD
jgi:hypothetical protein